MSSFKNWVCSFTPAIRSTLISSSTPRSNCHTHSNIGIKSFNIQSAIVLAINAKINTSCFVLTQPTTMQFISMTFNSQLYTAPLTISLKSVPFQMSTYLSLTDNSRQRTIPTIASPQNASQHRRFTNTLFAQC